MAFIPLYYVQSFLGAFQGQNNAVAPEVTIATSQNNMDLGIDTAAGAFNVTYSPQNPQGAPFHGQYYRIFPINCTSASNITGFVAPAVSANQMTPIVIKNTGTATITLKNAATSATANQINC